jgi:hypothetical protein
MVNEGLRPVTRAQRPNSAGQGAQMPLARPRAPSRDVGARLADYFPVPSIRHYLIARTGRPTIIHHRRGEGELIETRIVTSGAIELDPPGLTLELDRLYR